MSGAVVSGPQAGLSGGGSMVIDQVYGSAQFTGSFSFQTAGGTTVAGSIQDGTVSGDTLQLEAVVGTVQDQVTIDLTTATTTQMAGTWHDSLGNTGTMSATRVGAAPVQGLQYTYAYDAAGNRTQETVNGQTTTYSYNAANELTQVVSPTGTRTYTYDAAGNETSNGTDTYSYDALGQLTGATTPTGSYTYVYSGDGLRYEKTGPSGSTRYYWALGETLTETNAQGTVTADNLYGLNLIARTAGGTTGFYLYDGHGNVVDVASGSTILDSYRYDPFGNILSQTGSFPNPYLYAGEPYDPETGNYYLESRYYDPATGRFLTPDTLAGNPADPLNLDLYVYVDNNPLTRIDPTGHQEDEILDEITQLIENGPEEVKAAENAAGEVWDVLSGEWLGNAPPPSPPGSIANVESTLQDIADNLEVNGRQPVAGTNAHTLFARAVRQLARSNPNIDIKAEVTYEAGSAPGEPRLANYATRGAIRLDAVLDNSEDQIVAVFDLKTGRAGLTASRIQQIQSIVGDVPVIEIRPGLPGMWSTVTMPLPQENWP